MAASTNPVSPIGGTVGSDGARAGVSRTPAPDPFDPIRTLSEGGLWSFHPRDPQLRVTGRSTASSQDGTDRRRHEDAAAGATSDGGERSSVARTAMMVGIGGGLVQNAIDVTRLVKKYPEALRAGRFEPALGRAGRMPTALALTALTRPDARVIDPSAPRIASTASGGKSFTRFDEAAMKSSVLLGASLAGLQIAASIPNLHDALSKDGPWYENLAQSTSGRAGVLQLAGGGLGVTLFATALRQTRGEGSAAGVVQRIITAGKAPIMARPIFGQIGTATGIVVMANELGYLDFLNRGETRAAPTVLRDAARRTPVFNDPALRTAAIVGGSGIVGYKAHRAIQAAGGIGGGGLAGLGKGHVAGAAIFAGLLGAQLLGGLGSLDKPHV